MTHEKSLKAMVKPTDLSTANSFVTSLASDTEEVVTQLGRLESPRGDEKGLAPRLVSSFRRTATNLRKLSSALLAEDFTAAAAAATEMNASIAEADEVGRELGTRICADDWVAAAAVLTPTLPSILKSGFIAKADARCAIAKNQLDALPEPDSEESLALVLEQTALISEEMVNDLRLMQPPPAEQEAVDRLLGYINVASDKLVQAKTAAAVGNRALLEELISEINDLNAKATTEADLLGFRDCGRAGSI